MIRAAVVGIGHWGRTVINAVQGNSDKIRFTAGQTRTPSKVEGFCAEKGIPLYDSLDAVLADPAIDAVYFATPHSEHGGQVERTAAAGKHVFMEKPFTLDRRSAAAAIDAAARAGVTLGVAYPRRFHPGMVELKSRIDSGALGTIAHCYGEQNTPAGMWMSEGSWRATQAEAPGGAMTALGVHNVDAMIHLFGEIDEVYASSLRRAVAYDAEDTTSVMFQMKSGLSASMVCSLVTAVSYRLAVFGSKGCAELRTPNLDFHFTPIPLERPTGRQVGVPPQVTEYSGFNGLLAELEAFAVAIEGGPAYPIPPAQVLHAVAVFEAIIQSAARRARAGAAGLVQERKNMPVTVLFPEARQQPDAMEQGVFGDDVKIVKREAASSLSEISDADCAEADGLMIMGFAVTGADLARFPKLRCIVRMGVGYDKLDRPAAAARSVLVCNVPDYGTTEVADHAVALALCLRRGILLHHEYQRHNPPEPWRSFQNPLIERLGTQTFGIVGLGRIGTAVALRAKAFNFRVVFYDPKHPNGHELGLGIERAATLEDLMRQTNTLSIHCPLTVETKGMIGYDQLSLLPPGAVVVNDARGPILDLDALHKLLKSGHIAGAGLDVLPVEPPVEPIPELLHAYRAKEEWLEGRVVITPHSAWLTPHSWMDTRRKSAETMRAALLTNNPQNVITPDMF